MAPFLSSGSRSARMSSTSATERRSSSLSHWVRSGLRDSGADRTPSERSAGAQHVGRSVSLSWQRSWVVELDYVLGNRLGARRGQERWDNLLSVTPPLGLGAQSKERWAEQPWKWLARNPGWLFQLVVMALR